MGDSTPKRRRRSMSKMCESPVVAAHPIHSLASLALASASSPAGVRQEAQSKEQAPRRRRSMTKTCENMSTNCSLQAVQDAQIQAFASPVGEPPAAGGCRWVAPPSGVEEKSETV